MTPSVWEVWDPGKRYPSRHHAPGVLETTKDDDGPSGAAVVREEVG
ncbi:hypothetical protein BJ994_002044 [Arthrobacter pigmenti]|uniref:Uncharacterized protein n=1 Tax=Arthrobacter pigmenti TaxID=271432 RepID=A0A846RI74_9MICC|nr:hypothetical protein [Arthrobacter pigmenti]NJC22968.1 hypothetical protein [Arthrobacter pigmenti]